jgi:Calcineurin-like phosphoesterase
VISSAYVHIQRKKEGELLADDKVILDVIISRLNPSTGKKGKGDEQWEARSGGIWIKRSAKRHSIDKNTVTGVDVLFGADAVDPREGWEIKDTSLLDSSGEARLSIRKGEQIDSNKPGPRIRDNGKFKILHVADLHLSTGFHNCRDPVPDLGGECDADSRTLEFIGKMLDEEKPDLVVLTGDQLNGETAPDAQSVCDNLAVL